MEFGLLDGGEDVERNGVGCMVISIIFAKQDVFVIRMQPFDRAVTS